MKGRAFTVASVLTLLIGSWMVNGGPRVDVVEFDPEGAVDDSNDEAVFHDVGRNEVEVIGSSVDPSVGAGDESSPPVVTRTLRDALAEFWGDEWEHMVDRFDDADLDGPFVAMPWDQASPRFEERLFLTEDQLEGVEKQLIDWPIDPNNPGKGRSAVLSDFGLDEVPEETWSRIEEGVADTNEMMAELAGRYALLIDEAILENWDTGRFLHAPATLSGLNSPYEGDLLFTQSMTGGGWAVSIAVEKGASPEFAAIDEKLGVLRQERYRRVAQILVPSPAEEGR